MNILLVTPLYPIMGRDELEQSTAAVHYLAKYWTTNNRVLCIKEYRHTLSHPGKLFRIRTLHYLSHFYEYEIDNVEVCMLEYLLPPMQPQMRKKQSINMSERVNNILKKKNFVPDVIISHMPTLNSADYVDYIIGNCPRIAVLHLSDNDVSNQIAMKRTLEIKYNTVFARSKSIYDIFHKRDLRNLQEEIVYSGIPIMSKKQKKDFNKNGEYTLIYAGKLLKSKGVDTIIRSLHEVNKVNKYRLLIVGTGKDEKYLKKMTSSLKMQKDIFFCGLCTREQVFEYMRCADIFVMPSVHETLGLVYLEAMACGCLTIGSKNEGIDGIINNGVNGFLVDSRSVSDLTVCLNDINTMPKEKLIEISENAVSTAMFYNEKDMSDKYLKLIKSVVSQYR